jgi:hypothetical protein
VLGKSVCRKIEHCIVARAHEKSPHSMSLRIQFNVARPASEAGILCILRIQDDGDRVRERPRLGLSRDVVKTMGQQHRRILDDEPRRKISAAG